MMRKLIYKKRKRERIYERYENKMIDQREIYQKRLK